MNPVPTRNLSAPSFPDPYRQMLYVQPFGSWIWWVSFGLIGLAALLWVLFSVQTHAVPGQAVTQGNQAVITLSQPPVQELMNLQARLYCNPTLTGTVTQVQGMRVLVNFDASSTTGVQASRSCTAEIILMEQSFFQHILR